MQSLREGARALGRAVQAGQIRAYRDLPVRNNQFVERMYNHREDLEMTATITAPMLASGFFWGFAVPYVVYEMIVAELQEPREGGQQLELYPQAVPPEPGRAALDKAEEE